ncbi:MAG: redoxin family protein [Pirellulales bacterium]|nr:redoxin family protein [Pirellulales bacterium]
MKLCFWWLNRSIFFGCLLFGLVVNVSTISASTHSEEPAAEPATEESAEVAKAEPDPFAVPEDATADELLAFIRKIQRLAPKDRTRQGIQEHVLKLTTASIEAADKILAGEATDEQLTMAIDVKIGMFNLAENFNAIPDVAKKRKEFVESLKGDQRPLVVAFAKRLVFIEEAREWSALDASEKDAFLERLMGYLSEVEIEKAHLQLVSNISRQIKPSQDLAAVKKLCLAVQPIFMKSKDKQLVDSAKQFFLTEEFAEWSAMDPSHKEACLEKLVGYLNETEIGRAHLYWINGIGRQIEYMGSPEDAVKLYLAVQPIFLKSDNKQLAEEAQSFDGIVRRLQLPGNEMPIEGFLLDGKEFDWSAYKGKVVLVDFWATWCSPCIREMPNVKEAYKNYHAKGFDIVGISLDEDIEKVKKYVETNQIPWAILFSDVEEATGWKHPMAVHYGIQAIPATILVGQDGKVVSLSARGTALGNQLKELLGDPSPPEEEKEEAAPGADTTDDPKEKNEGDSD